MPWKETCAVDERERFVENWLASEASKTELCEIYRISRKTAYKWLGRFRKEGQPGLMDRGRAPHHCPHALNASVKRLLLAARKAHPRWGPRKILAWIAEGEERHDLPAASTVGDLFKREGLVKPRRRRQRATPTKQPFAACSAPNDVWCVDYKGQFKVGSGELCYPLTLSDGFSRYLLACRGHRRISACGAQDSLQEAFERFGLPTAMRSDNGQPFGSTGIGGLTRLVVWLIKLGVKPERIEPGQPQQNGRHERMHRTLKAETALPPRSSFRRQQIAFDDFLTEFNEERPHEALGNLTPASVYIPSPKPMPRHVPEVAYPTNYEVRRVKHTGEIKWRNRQLFVSEALRGEDIGLVETDTGLFEMFFGSASLAFIDHLGRIHRRPVLLWAPVA